MARQLTGFNITPCLHYLRVCCKISKLKQNGLMESSRVKGTLGGSQSREYTITLGMRGQTVKEQFRRQEADDIIVGTVKIGEAGSGPQKTQEPSCDTRLYREDAAPAAEKTT